MSVNMSAVVVATIAEFIVGAIWYMPVFGKLWGKIHGHDKLSKAEQKEAEKGLAPLLGVQLLITVMTTYVLAKFASMLPNESIYSLAIMCWFGFVIPTQIAAIIFGGTKPKWFVTKALIMASGSFVCLMAAAAILKAM